MKKSVILQSKNSISAHIHDRSTITYRSRNDFLRDSIHYHVAGLEWQFKEDYLSQHTVGGEPAYVARAEQIAELEAGDSDERTGAAENRVGGAESVDRDAPAPTRGNG